MSTATDSSADDDLRDHATAAALSVPTSEDALLSLGLRDADCAAALVDRVTDEHLASETNRVLRQTIASLVSDNLAVSITSVVSLLTRNHDLDKAGGLPRIVDLARQAVTAPEWQTHYLLVNDALLERHMQATVGTLQTLSTAGGSAEERLSMMQDAVLALDTARKDDRTLSYHDGVGDAVEALRNRANGSVPRGLMSGLDEVDRYWSGGQPGDLVVIAGRPAMGKTVLLETLSIAALSCEATPGSIELFSYEMSAQSLIQRSIASRSGIAGLTSRFGKPYSKAEEDALIQASCAVSQMNINVHRDCPGISGIIARCQTAKRRGPVKAIAIDYLQLIPPEAGYKEPTLTAHVSRLTPKLKQLAMTLGVTVFLLSQLNRGVEQRDNKRPRMSDLRESGSIEQDADVVMMLYRDEVYYPDSPDRGVVEIICTKQRNGPTFTAKQAFHGPTFRISNLDPYEFPMQAPNGPASSRLPSGTSRYPSIPESI